MTDHDVTTEPAEPADGAPRKPPAISPSRVKIQSQHDFCWSEYEVRLPIEAALQDLNDPSIWKKVQASQQPLRRLDKLRILPYDESWIVECFVAGATERGVTLSKPVKTDLPPRTEQLFEDDSYRLVWTGGGYAAQRKSDNRIMTTETVSRALAERDLKNLYPRRG